MALHAESLLASAIKNTWGDISSWKNNFISTALTRGIGWAILYFDPKTDTLINAWVDEQHLGHLTGLQVILAFDMWEHSYLFDYIPAQKKDYVEALFANLNWSVCEQRFSQSKTIGQ
jgi:Fe-Mn family superoxide dismutase